MNAKPDRVVLVLIALILVAFVYGAYAQTRQASQLAALVRAQSPLTFQFVSTNPAGQTTLFDVVCTRLEGRNVYDCTTAPRPGSTPAPRVVTPTPEADSPATRPPATR